MLSKRDPVTAELANMKKKSDTYHLETKRLFQEQSPMNRMLADIRAKNDESFQYRLRILHNVPTFADFHVVMLKSIADSMEVLNYVKGDDIIVQNDVGDAFYVLEHGRVKVMRKGNAYEVAHEIRQLSKGAHFGELSLLSDEPRSATITVISETARALKLSRQTFEETVKSLRTMGIKPKEIDSKTIVEKVPLFKSLSAALKKKIEETMQLMQFPAEHYICKQGSNGTTFYILTSGSLLLHLLPQNLNVLCFPLFSLLFVSLQIHSLICLSILYQVPVESLSTQRITKKKKSTRSIQVGDGRRQKPPPAFTADCHHHPPFDLPLLMLIVTFPLVTRPLVICVHHTNINNKSIPRRPFVCHTLS